MKEKIKYQSPSYTCCPDGECCPDGICDCGECDSCCCDSGKISRASFMRCCAEGAGLMTLTAFGMGLSKPAAAANEKDNTHHDAPRLPLELVPGKRLDPGMKNVLGLAFDQQDRLMVAGEGGVKIFDKSGSLIQTLAMPEAACCLTAAKDGTIFVAHRKGVRVFNAEGVETLSFGNAGKGSGKFSYITGIALHGSILYITDAGNRRFSRFAMNGDFIDDQPGFLIPSGYFDCAVDDSGNFFIGHTGRHRVERYDRNMQLVEQWGQFGIEPENFCGCCNPTHIALFADGRIATAEKGLFRLKVYDPAGKLLACREINPLAEADVEQTHDHAVDSAVGGLAPLESKSLDLAIDSSGRIAMVEPLGDMVRFYTLNAVGDTNG